jgi:imidazolonepropionase-like amidohydrolase
MHAAGVPLAVGSDAGSCFNPVGMPLLEMNRWRMADLSPMDILTAATSGSARLLNLQDALGRVAVGYRADLLVVAGRPDERLADLERVQTVIIDGVLQAKEAPGFWSKASLGLRLGWSLLTD